MKSSRSPRRRRSAPSVVVAAHGGRPADTDRTDDPPPPYMMRHTRLRGALEDAHGILLEQAALATTPRPLEQLFQRMAPTTTAMSFLPDQEDHACAAVAAQVAALERQLPVDADSVDALRQAMRAELEAWHTPSSSGSRSNDPIRRVDAHSGGANAWYVLGKVVGRGTFGRVQIAHHRLSDARVAIKSYFRDKGASVCSPPPQGASCSASSAKRPQARPPAGESDALEWKRVRQEVKLMASLWPHAGLVGFIEAFETPTQLHVVMEFASGGSLCELLKKQPQQRLREPTARRLFAQLCNAVGALHRQNVIHRDLKLENVLLDEQLHPRIIDFGFSQREYPSNDSSSSSRSLPTSRGVKNFCGTPSYMAPEVVACKSYDGKRVDIWSLGVLLYLLLCGKFPFQASSLHQLYQTIRSAPLVFPPGVSKDAQHLVQSILVVDPDKRATLEAIQGHAWMNQPPSADQSTALARARAFDSFLAWEGGLSTVCDALARLYGLDASCLFHAVRSASASRGSRSHNTSSAVALVRLTMLAAEQQCYAATQTAPRDTCDMVVAVTKPTDEPPPSPRLHAKPTHKQQLEQLIGLVKQSLA